ncbi:hypothetical protein BH18THE2_BH18THE2_40890 [soil metagenome]
MRSVVIISSDIIITSSFFSIREQVKVMPKVQSFLESVSWNSKNSSRVYESGIIYFLQLSESKRS